MSTRSVVGFPAVLAPEFSDKGGETFSPRKARIERTPEPPKWVVRWRGLHTGLAPDAAHALGGEDGLALCARPNRHDEHGIIVVVVVVVVVPHHTMLPPG
jgi:hypothetical protein